MRFSEDTAASHSIHSYREGEILVDGRPIRHSVIITHDVIEPWSPRSIDQLEQSHFSAFAEWQPEIVLLGTGGVLRFPPPHFSVDLLARGIGVEIMANDAACRTFNILLTEERRVLLALLLG
jgi:uncharacterized protein